MFKKYKIYFLIALPILLFNLIAVFGVDVLLKDDAYRYNDFIEDPTLKFKNIHFLFGHITHWITFGILSLSPELIRAIYLLFVILPISCLIYKLLHEKMGVPKIAAYSAVVLPTILPYQYDIPAFVNGTHVSIGLLAVVTCFFASFKYLDTEGPKQWRMLLSAAFIYLTATLVTDQPLFSLPLLVFSILGYNKLNKKHLFLAASFFLVALHKAAWVLSVPRASTKVTAPTLSNILDRAGEYFSSMLPVPGFFREFKILTGIIFVLIVITGFILYLTNRNQGFELKKSFAHLSHKKFIFYIYGFLLTWVISHIIVFITISPRGFRVRYTYIAAYGLNALLVISLYPILKKIFAKKNLFICLVFSVIILISGISRFVEFKVKSGRLIADQAMIIAKLKEFKLPAGSQIVIYLNYGKNYWGDWRQSSGHLKYILRKKDVNGLIGPKARVYYNFYDPFNVKERGFGEKYWLRGLDIARPLYLFVEKNNKLQQYEYALRWDEKEARNKARWTILKVDKKTGKTITFISGSGWQEYSSTIKKLRQAGVYRAMICWGGPAKKKDLKRLRLKRLEQIRLKRKKRNETRNPRREISSQGERANFKS